MLFLDSLSFVSKFSQLLEVSQTAQNLRDTWHVSRNTFATCIRFLSFLFMLCLLSSRNSIVVPVKRVQGIIVKGRAVVHFIQERFRETSIMHRKIPLGINGNLLNHKTASLLTDTVQNNNLNKMKNNYNVAHCSLMFEIFSHFIYIFYRNRILTDLIEYFCISIVNP